MRGFVLGGLGAARPPKSSGRRPPRWPQEALYQSRFLWPSRPSRAPSTLGGRKVRKRLLDLIPDYAFFRQHGSSVIGEDATRALRLARVEAEAKRRGFSFDWETDNDFDIDDISRHTNWCREAERAEREGREPDCRHEVYDCFMRAWNGDIVEVLGGIIDPDNDYRRVVEAELADGHIDLNDGWKLHPKREIERALRRYGESLVGQYVEHRHNGTRRATVESYHIEWDDEHGAGDGASEFATLWVRLLGSEGSMAGEVFAWTLHRDPSLDPDLRNTADRRFKVVRDQQLNLEGMS